MANVDSLSIEISAEAKNAAASLINLTKKLDGVSASLSGIKGNGLKNFSSGMKELSTAMQGIKDVNASQFTKVAKGIQKFESIDTAKIAPVSNAIKPLAQSINTMNGLAFDGKSITSFINSIARLSQVNAGSLNSVNFEQIGASISKMTTALSGASDVSRSTISITNAIAKLGAAGGTIGQVTTELPALGTALKRFISTMSGAATVSAEVISFTSAVGQLASAGARTATTAKNLDDLAEALKRFFQTMSTASTVNDSIVKMTQALANLASQGSKVRSTTNSLASYANQSLRVGSSSKSLISGLKRFVTGAKSAQKSSKSLAAAFGKLYASYFLLIRAVKGIGDAIDISSDLTEVQNVVDVTFKQYSDVMEDFAGTVSMTEYGISELTAKEIGSRYQAMANAIGLTNDEAAKANTFLSGMTDGYVEANGTVADMSVNLTKLAADMASLYNVEASDVAESLESIYTGTTKPLRQYGLDLTQATLSEWALKNGLDADISSMTQAEKVLLRYQYVLANTTDSQGDFARTSDTWANRVKVLKQQFQALAAIIGEVFVNALKPALRALNSFMTSVISIAQTIADALGAIFGWTIDTSDSAGTLDDTADSAEDVSDGLSDAAASAEKLNSQLQGFDKLNVITTNDSGSSDSSDDSGNSSSSSSAAATSLVETDSILKKYESSIDSLYELGVYIGDVLTDAMNSIDWDGIYKTAENWGTGLANFLNGLISPELFSAIGKTVASSLNTALHFIDGFGTTFDWSNFGNSLASGLNTFLITLDWSLALKNAQTYGEGIATALNDFISGTDFSVIGATVANALNTQIQFALSVGTTFDFKEFGKKISDAINGFFSTFSFANLAESINAWIKGALTTAATALNGTDFEQIGEKIGEFLADLDITEMVGDLALVLWEAIKGAFSLLKGLFEEAPLETAMIGAFAILKFTGVGEQVANALKTAIATALGTEFAAGLGMIIVGGLTAGLSFVNMWQNGFDWGSEIVMGLGTALAAVGLVVAGIVSAPVAAIGAAVVTAIATVVILVKDHWEEITQFFSDAWETIKGVWKAVSGWFSDHVIEPVKSAFSTLKEKVSGFFSTLWSGIKGVWNTVSGWFKEHVIEPVVTVFNGVKTRVSQIFKGLWIIIKAVWKLVSGWFSEHVIEPVKSAFKTLKEKVSGFFSTLWSGIKGVWNAVSGWFSEHVIEPVKSAFSTLKEKVSGFFSSLWSGIKGVWKAVSGWFKEHVIEPVQSAWETATDAISGFFSSLWSGIKKGVVGAMNGVIGGIEGGINFLIGAINGLLTGFNKVVKWAAKIVGEDWDGVSLIKEVSLGRISVDKYAAGGFPDSSSLFIAGENGIPELLGTVGGKTAVAGGEEITGIADAVYTTGQTEASLLRTAVSLLNIIAEKDYGISANDLYKSVRNSDKIYAKRTGNSGFAY